MWAAFLIGLAGSLHCIGMCGPLLLALPPEGKSRGALLFESAVYHFSRAASYALLGAIFGALGEGLFMLGLQKTLSFGAGAALVAAAVAGKRIDAWAAKGPAHRLRGKWGRAFAERRTMVMGFLNGLLPCGMVYAAVIGAAATGNWAGGGLFMFLFGLGTMPLLFLLTAFRVRLSLAFRKQLQWIRPVLLVAAGILLIVRGLGADAIFPDWWVPGAQPDCH